MRAGSRKSLLICEEKTRESVMTSRAGPSAMISPSPRRITRSARWAASSTSWVARMTVRPSSRRWRRMCCEGVLLEVVEAPGRLVEDESLGVARQDGGQGHALALAHAQVAGVARCCSE